MSSEIAELKTTQERKPKQYRVYGKLKKEKRFKALDMDEGSQVGNLIYATIVTINDVLTEERFNTILESMRIDNPTWDFEKREIK